MSDQETLEQPTGPSANPFLARYHKIQGRLRWFNEELDHDQALARATGDDSALSISRSKALGGLTDQLAGFDFNVGLGALSAEEWRKVYATESLSSTLDFFLTKVEDLCNRYDSAMADLRRRTTRSA